MLLNVIDGYCIGNALHEETNGDDNLKDDAYGKLVTWIIDMADTDCTGKDLMQDMLDGETVLHNTGFENMSWKSSISPWGVRNQRTLNHDSARCISTSPRAKGKRTISEEGFRKKEKYRMSIRNKPVKSFLDDSVKSSKNSMSQQTTVSIEDEDGVIIENIHQDSDEEKIPLRPLSVESDNAGKVDVSFES
ncbi:Hypothetical predicted protein [Mytilus galloprovincialis]|uniref:Uncharacterized protein n=1 Tax=Mytilus galloprovincialis TaxID=29158 RepID=A0A8B6DIX8_MYTGA|nr:Hypothetical predicted protein [Mytilus galloprovincialis]